MGAHVSIPMYQRALSERYRLAGYKCKACQKINFPRKGVCAYCHSSSEFDEVNLSGKGTVYSFTLIAAGGAPPEFAEEAAVKGTYPVVLVQLDEGPKIVSQLADHDFSKLTIGARVEAVVRRIYSEENVIRYGYRFKLLEKEPD